MSSWSTAETVVTLVVGTPIGAAALYFAARTYQHDRSAAVRENQAKLRTELKEKLQRQGRIKKSVNILNSRMPSSLVQDELRDLQRYLELRKHDLLAPTPQQLDNLILCIAETLFKWDDVVHPIDNQRIYLVDVELEEREKLQIYFVAVQKRIDYIIDGLRTIEQKPLSLRRQRRLFKDLDPR